MKYKEIECSCGKIARILFCGIGIYVTCSYCGKTGKIKDTEEEAMESWRGIKKTPGERYRASTKEVTT